jgi:hypothetical protein
MEVRDCLCGFWVAWFSVWVAVWATRFRGLAALGCDDGHACMHRIYSPSLWHACGASVSRCENSRQQRCSCSAIRKLLCAAFGAADQTPGYHSRAWLQGVDNLPAGSANQLSCVNGGRLQDEGFCAADVMQATQLAGAAEDRG